MAEIAICATDLAEVIGTAIGLNLLFGIPLELGVFITALDVFLILYLQNLGFRWIEAFVVTTLLVIAACFAIQVGMARPDIREVILGFAPTVEIVRNPEMLYLAMGILGATVMPHNLYLHSSIVQTRMVADTIPAKREAIKFATIDSTIALMLALLVNASILILAAATFHKAGQYNVADLGDAQQLLTPLLGSAAAATAFGDRAPVLRPELDRDGDALRPDRHGGLHQRAPAGLGAAARHALARHHPGGHRHRALWGGGHRQAAHPEPGHPLACSSRSPSCRSSCSPRTSVRWACSSRRAG